MPTASNLCEVIDAAPITGDVMQALSTCHQCRHRTPKLSASCKNFSGNKSCLIKMCHRCLFNRYGEVAQTVSLLEDWKCPKCRGICNCSVCLKKCGSISTGLLVDRAKKNGVCSAPELVHSEDSTIKAIADQPLKSPANTKKRERLAEITPSVGDRAPISQQRNDKKARTGTQDSRKIETKENITVLKKEYVANAGSNMKDANGKKKMIKDTNSNGFSKEKGTLMSVLTGTKHTLDRDSSEKSLHKSKQNKKSANASKPSEVVENNSKKTKIADLLDGKVNETCNTKSSEGSNTKKLTHFFNRLNHSSSNNDLDIDETARTFRSHSSNPLKPHSFLKASQNEKKPSFPIRIRINSVSGIETSPEEVGEVLQFLEFCEIFGKKVLNLKKGQAEAIVRDLLKNKRQLRSHYKSQHTLFAQTHVTLINIIKGRDEGKQSWVQRIGEIVSELKHVGKEFARENFDKYYDGLKACDKLRLLNTLCDEALNTIEMRKWIDDHNALAAIKQKESNKNVLEAMAKEREVKKKMREFVRSGSKNEKISLALKHEANDVRKSVAEAISVISNKESGDEFLRTDPCLNDNNGKIIWRLRCLHGSSNFLLQEIKNMNFDEEKWFSYDLETNDFLHDYLSLFKQWGRITPKLGKENNF